MTLAARSLLALALLLGLGVCGLLYLTVPPSPDQSQFDWMAFIALQGAPYYAGSFDMNWPGAMWLHEIGLRLFGVAPWTWRLTDFLLMLGFTAGGAVFLSRLNWQVAAVVFIALYPPLYITAGGWMAGQRDIMAAGFLLAACALAVPAPQRKGMGLLVAGGFIAAAVLIRPTYLSFLAGILLLEALPLKRAPSYCSRWGRAARLAGGFVVVMGAAGVLAYAQGFLDDWYQMSFQFALSVYVGEPPQQWPVTLSRLFLQSWHWITLLALLGMVLWLRRDGLSYGLVLMLGIAATGALSFAVQKKYFGYHLGGLLLVLVLFMAIAFDGLNAWRRRAGSGLGRWAAVGVLGFAALLACAGIAKKLTNLSEGARLIASGSLGPQAGYGLTEADRRTIVGIMQQGTTPQERIAVYGTDYDLAYRAERLPSYRFFTPAADQIHPDFDLYDVWVAEIDANLAEHPPIYVVIDKSLIEDTGQGPRTIFARLSAHIAEGYAPVFENDRVIVHERQR